tara:strand:+ start:170 stop:373 length:204 start_codon:yes stop_codon:yes gene_type:complete
MVCCHAEQDKVYAKEIDGLRWEWYVVNDVMPEIKPDTKTCCEQQEAQAAAENLLRRTRDRNDRKCLL